MMDTYAIGPSLDIGFLLELWLLFMDFEKYVLTGFLRFFFTMQVVQAEVVDNVNIVGIELFKRRGEGQVCETSELV